MNENLHDIATEHTTGRVLSAEGHRLAHDLYNDLNVILGHCSLLSDHLSDNSDEAKHLHLIQEAARHMTNRIAERQRQLVQESIYQLVVRDCTVRLN